MDEDLLHSHSSPAMKFLIDQRIKIRKRFAERKKICKRFEHERVAEQEETLEMLQALARGYEVVKKLAQKDTLSSSPSSTSSSSSASSSSSSTSSPSSSSSNAASLVATAAPSASAQCASAGEPSVVSVRLGAFHAYNQAFGRKSDLGITVKATFSAPAPGVGLCVTLITPHGQVGSPSYTTSCVCGGECGGACVCE